MCGGARGSGGNEGRSGWSRGVSKVMCFMDGGIIGEIT